MMQNPFELLHPELKKLLPKFGIKKPNLGQDVYIPAIIEGKHTLIAVPTGYGKTIGTLLGVIEQLLRLKEKSNNELPVGFYVLFITPLKSLNRDIFRRVLPVIGEKIGIRIEVRHGDTSAAKRRRQTLKPPHILVTTPESLQVILPAKIIGRKHLKTLRIVILDEIHNIVATKRGVQLTLALERLKRVSQNKLQIIGLSATIGNLQAIKKYIFPRAEDVVLVSFKEKPNMQVTVDFPQRQSHSERMLEINHWSKTLNISREDALRLIKIVDIMKQSTSTLIFTNTRQLAEILGWKINQLIEQNLLPDFKGVEVHHSSLSKDVRLDAEDKFRSGSLTAVIATSSLELGIDIGKIETVIQFMSPRRIDTLLQRVGRSGHRVELQSKGYILCTNPRDVLESAAITALALQGSKENTETYPLALDVLLHQIVGILQEEGPLDVVTLHKIIQKSPAYQFLSRETLLKLISFAESLYILRSAPTESSNNPIIFLKRHARKYYLENVSTIMDTAQFVVKDLTSQRRVGVLDEEFVAKYGEVGQVFVLKGKPWQIVSLNIDDKIVEAIPLPTFEAALPSWEGELIPVSYKVAQYVKKLFSQQKLRKQIEAFLTEDSKQSFQNFIEKQNNIAPIKENSVIIESGSGEVAIHTFLGSKANEALALYLVSRLQLQKKAHVLEIPYKSDAYTVVIQPGLGLTALIKQIIEESKPEHVEILLKRFTRESDLFKWRLIHVARRFGLLKRDSAPITALLRYLHTQYANTIVGDETLNEIFFEKYDVKTLKKFFRDIQEGKLTIKVYHRNKLESPLAQAALDPHGFHLTNADTRETIRLVVKERLRKSRVYIACMRPDCDYEREIVVDYLEDPLKCPKCKQRFLFAGPPTEKSKKVKKIVKKFALKKKLTAEEKKILKDAQRAADLVLNFGQAAVLALVARGIGPNTAYRALNKLINGENAFIDEIIRLESEFARTRMFWH